MKTFSDLILLSYLDKKKINDNFNQISYKCFVIRDTTSFRLANSFRKNK